MWDKVRKWFEVEQWEVVRRERLTLKAFSPLFGDLPTEKGWVIIKRSNKGRVKAFYATVENEREINLEWVKAELGITDV